MTNQNGIRFWVHDVYNGELLGRLANNIPEHEYRATENDLLSELEQDWADALIFSVSAPCTAFKDLLAQTRVSYQKLPIIVVTKKNGCLGDIRSIALADHNKIMERGVLEDAMEAAGTYASLWVQHQTLGY